MRSTPSTAVWMGCCSTRADCAHRMSGRPNPEATPSPTGVTAIETGRSLSAPSLTHLTIPNSVSPHRRSGGVLFLHQPDPRHHPQQASPRHRGRCVLYLHQFDQRHHRSGVTSSGTGRSLSAPAWSECISRETLPAWVGLCSPVSTKGPSITCRDHGLGLDVWRSSTALWWLP